ncbi:unnamed protein product [Effrenium voratum]|nr:unnamed protein product [Effrenium voratum]|mmetsp:Transcript_67274/g.160446  ORF Transcript_67274/g.160446 Transcript_67274/m.160446 type:complete len:321 (-) Transcript_67274:53-1015(-)
MDVSANASTSPRELKTGFQQQISVNSDASTTHSLEELSAVHFFEKHCSDIDVMTSRVVRASSIREVIGAVVADGQVSVTVGDPRSEDACLIAVSQQFEAMTGYCRQEILGKNCRFLSSGCGCDNQELVKLRRAVKTGEPYTGVLENRRKSGELFLNLLDLCGLTVARNPASGDELWFLVGIQADVSNLAPSALQEVAAEVHQVARDIRAKLADQLSALAISGALMSNFTAEGQTLQTKEYRLSEPDPEVWTVLPFPQWRGTIPTMPSCQTMMEGFQSERCEAWRESIGGDPTIAATRLGLLLAGSFVLAVALRYRSGNLR